MKANTISEIPVKRATEGQPGLVKAKSGNPRATEGNPIIKSSTYPTNERFYEQSNCIYHP